MKKYTLPGGILLLCLLLLAGCRTITMAEYDFDVDGITKAQKIVLHDASGNEKGSLTEEAEIDAFVEAVNVEGWHIADLPEHLTPAGSFTLWQTGTVTAFMDQDGAESVEICTFRCYQNGDYLTIEAGPVDISFTIPKASADYLRGLLEP